ncbi:unnamed protein product [Leptidea sinapis]|uniref:RBR-type E3 ubiquitin transferase n=1 Tax=Leptidea sinapis TaxID=189913 RepID=A0A5E4Q1P1_9NEOP|nr:unnamed protein product [Leptidea sinapis]
MFLNLRPFFHIEKSIAKHCRFYATRKRFYRRADVIQNDRNWGVTLDHRKLKTPNGQLLTVNSEDLARALAAEWDAQQDIISQPSMHLTALCNTALDNPGKLSQHDITTINFGVETLKSPILMLACVDRYLQPTEAVMLARLEEEYQLRRWGRVPWAHELNQMELTARVAAALLIVQTSTDYQSAKEKKKNESVRRGAVPVSDQCVDCRPRFVNTLSLLMIQGVMNIDVETAAPRPRPLSAGIWTLFSWMRRSEKSLSQESISSVGSDRTAASFDFLSPGQYRYSRDPLLISPAPITDSYRKRLHENNQRRKRERDITLHRKYGLWKEEGAGYDGFSLPPLPNNYNEAGEKKVRCRRAASECLQRRSAYVPGKRRAPLPPLSTTSKSLPRNYKRKRPAPKPPVNELLENTQNTEINNNDEKLFKVTATTCEIDTPDKARDSNLEKIKDPGQHKETKVKVEKSFIRQLFENKKRSSAIEIPQVRLLPSISELDKEAAEIIEINKYPRNYNSHNNQEMAGEMWMCTKCLRKYNMTIKACVYCVSQHKNTSSLFTQTDHVSSRVDETKNKLKVNDNSEEKEKLREMLKELKHSLPKKHIDSKLKCHNSINKESVTTEAATLRIGSPAADKLVPQQNILTNNNNNKNNSIIISLDVGDPKKGDTENLNSTMPNRDNTLLENTKIEPRLVPKISSDDINRTTKSGASTSSVEIKLPMKNHLNSVNCNQIKASPETVITSSKIKTETEIIKKGSSDATANKDFGVTASEIKKTSEQTAVKLNWLNGPSTSTNQNLNTPLKISSLLNPIYLPKSKILTENLCTSHAIATKHQISTTGAVESKQNNLQTIKERKDESPVKSEKNPIHNNENLCKLATRRDLINQLELSIAKGDEKVAAEAASKLAKLRVACSVLSFSSQIVAEPSTSKHFVCFNTETPEPATVHQKDECKNNLSNSHDKKPNEIIKFQQCNSTQKDVCSTKEIIIENVTRGKTSAASQTEQVNVSTLKDLRQIAEKMLGLEKRLQRWIVGKTLCIDDTIKLDTVAGKDFKAPFYLCVVESENKNQSIGQKEFGSESNENATAIETSGPSSVNTSREFYNELIKLEQQAIVSNSDSFECGVCMETCGVGKGVVLRDCIHTFCRECLGDVVRHCEEPIVSCPAIGCPGVLQEREIRALISEEDYDKWLARGLAVAESGTRNTFHCRTPDCTGWAFCEPGVRKFPCPVCKHTNCVPCLAVHEATTCEQYQRQLHETVTAAAGNTQTDEGTQELLNSLISRGEALECPECKSIITKKWGCDWVKCSACKTEICWITKGRRWGPGGKGDTSAGCPPSAVVGGRNMPATDAANTAPSPMARGARMLRNSPEGAQIAISVNSSSKVLRTGIRKLKHVEIV